MLNQPTIEKLHTMKMHGMDDAFRAQLETTESHQLSFEERFAFLVDQQWLWKENRALGRRLRRESLPACFLRQGTRQPAFADTSGTGEHQIEFLAHPFAAGQRTQEPAIQLAGMLVVDILDHGALFQLGTAQRSE